jgi:hypothetical protein
MVRINEIFTAILSTIQKKAASEKLKKKFR